MKGKFLTIVVAVTAFSLPSFGQDVSSPGTDEDLCVMFWNLENFFDWRDGGLSKSDSEFSSAGQRHWTKKRFYTKCNAIAKTIFWTQDMAGKLPDVIGFAETENSFVIKALLQESPLRKTAYRAVHFDSPDSRGIDVALLFRSDIFEKISAKPCHLYDSNKSVMTTRDILCVTLRRLEDGRIFHFLVNHHPSKFSGATASQPRRETAMKRLREICDSLLSLPAETPFAASQNIVAMGDFNDTPDNPLFEIFDGCLLNLALPLHRRGEGTIRFNGKWDLIDIFLVSPSLHGFRQEILYPPFLMIPDTVHGGQKPLRTYTGLRYQGGVSDHLPIVLLK